VRRPLSNLFSQGGAATRASPGLAFLALISCAMHSLAPGSASPSTSTSEPIVGSPTLLPTEFIADRIFVRPTMTDGRRVKLYTDTGGGWQFLFTGAVSRLGLPTSVARVGGEDVTLTSIPSWRAGESIPPPLAIHDPPELETSYAVTMPFAISAPDDDGFLGEGWFAGRVWTFDYPGKRLLWRAPRDLPPHSPAEDVAFNMPHGPRAQSYGRITVTLDGKPIDLLFDTGATLRLSPSAVEALHDGAPADRATSFIVKSLFDAWRARHPDWRVIERAERGADPEPIIEVPRVVIGGHEVGPVWFTRRPDANFHDAMSADMDARVEGALGGSGLRYFVVTVDYSGERAVFQRGT